MPAAAHRPFALICCFSLLAVAPLATHPGCDPVVRSATREAKTLAYVGEVQFGETTREDDRVVVPLKYPGGQWGRNSAIVPIEVKSTVKDREIEITVVTSVATENGATEGYCVVLPKQSEGEYTVYYRDPDGKRHEIGKLRIER